MNQQNFDAREPWNYQMKRKLNVENVPYSEESLAGFNRTASGCGLRRFAL